MWTYGFPTANRIFFSLIQVADKPFLQARYKYCKIRGPSAVSVISFPPPPHYWLKRPHSEDYHGLTGPLLVSPVSAEDREQSNEQRGTISVPLHTSILHEARQYLNIQWRAT